MKMYISLSADSLQSATNSVLDLMHTAIVNGDYKDVESLVCGGAAHSMVTSLYSNFNLQRVEWRALHNYTAKQWEAKFFGRFGKASVNVTDEDVDKGKTVAMQKAALAVLGGMYGGKPLDLNMVKQEAINTDAYYWMDGFKKAGIVVSSFDHPIVINDKALTQKGWRFGFAEFIKALDSLGLRKLDGPVKPGKSRFI